MIKSAHPSISSALPSASSAERRAANGKVRRGRKCDVRQRSTREKQRPAFCEMRHAQSGAFLRNSNDFRVRALSFLVKRFLAQLFHSFRAFGDALRVYLRRRVCPRSRAPRDRTGVVKCGL